MPREYPPMRTNEKYLLAVFEARYELCTEKEQMIIDRMCKRLKDRIYGIGEDGAKILFSALAQMSTASLEYLLQMKNYYAGN